MFNFLIVVIIEKQFCVRFNVTKGVHPNAMITAIDDDYSRVAIGDSRMIDEFRFVASAGTIDDISRVEVEQIAAILFVLPMSPSFSLFLRNLFSDIFNNEIMLPDIFY